MYTCAQYITVLFNLLYFNKLPNINENNSYAYVCIYLHFLQYKCFIYVYVHNMN